LLDLRQQEVRRFLTAIWTWTFLSGKLHCVFLLYYKAAGLLVSKSKSLNNIINNYEVKRGIKLFINNVSVSENIDTLPLYMAMFCKYSF